MALGATPTGVLRMLLKESLWLALGGIAHGASDRHHLQTKRAGL